AQKPVWGQALRNEMWGESDPEWTAGDDAAGFMPRAKVPTYPSTSAATGELFLTSRLHGRVRIPLGPPQWDVFVAALLMSLPTDRCPPYLSPRSRPSPNPSISICSPRITCAASDALQAGRELR